MPDQPDIHRRRSIRLPDFDYSCSGAYFVTICAFQRVCLFGDVVDGVVRLNEAGVIVQRAWDDLPSHFRHVALDQFVIMPNHVHGIVVLTDGGARVASVGAQFIAPGHDTPHTYAGAMNRAPTVGNIVRAFKARCTHAINKFRHIPAHPVWQRNFYEHVIRDDRDLAAVREYIADNPAKWADDENYPGP